MQYHIILPYNCNTTQHHTAQRRWPLPGTHLLPPLAIIWHLLMIIGCFKIIWSPAPIFNHQLMTSVGCKLVEHILSFPGQRKSPNCPVKTVLETQLMILDNSVTISRRDIYIQNQSWWTIAQAVINMIVKSLLGLRSESCIYTNYI